VGSARAGTVKEGGGQVARHGYADQPQGRGQEERVTLRSKEEGQRYSYPRREKLGLVRLAVKKRGGGNLLLNSGGVPVKSQLLEIPPRTEKDKQKGLRSAYAVFT